MSAHATKRFFKRLAIVALNIQIASAAISRVGVRQIPVDTSFTTTNAWESVRKQFPDAVIVSSEQDSSIRVVRDVVYASPGGRSLHLDVYRPARSGTLPSVIIIHGGGWRSGNRHQEEPMAIALARNGYVAGDD